MNQSRNNTQRSAKRVNQLSRQMNGLSVRNRRRRRRRGTTNRANILQGGVQINDSEVFTIPKADDVVVLEFCPGKTGLVRLDNEAKKFKRWSLIRVVITYQPTASLSDSGSITYGILPGPKDTTVVKDTITRLRPFQKHALWKSSSLTVGSNVMIQSHMLTSGNNEDSIGFCVYIQTSNKDLGVFRVTYSVVLNYPEP